MSNVVSIKKLQEAIGEDSTDILKQRFAGKTIYFPKNPDDQFPDNVIRDQSIKNDYLSGMDIQNLQEKYGLSKSQIHHIKNSK